MPLTPEVVERLRAEFPGLARMHNGQPVVFLDGPAGTQVPQRVIDAIGRYLSTCNANHEGAFATSRESDAWIAEVHQAAADLVGAANPNEIVFGANMTTLTLHLSRAIGNTWTEGDEVVVTRLDHDANVRPWVLAARDAGATVHFAPVNTTDCTMSLGWFAEHINERTKMVAVGCASNSVGTINPFREITQMAHDAGALVFLDAVHYAPHATIDVAEWDCDFLAASAYKFFGPHIGILWGRERLLSEITPYKLNPAPDELPGRWMTGTQNFECLVGVKEAIDYIADIGRVVSSDDTLDRRSALRVAYEQIGEYESRLVQALIAGLSEIDGLTIAGITEPERSDQRMPTLSIYAESITSESLAQALDERGIYAWHGNYYAWELSHALGREPDGMVRLGVAHYNTLDEVERTVVAVRSIVQSIA